VPGCRDAPFTCLRDHIAKHLGLKPNEKKPWEFTGKCPRCDTRGFGIKAGDHQRLVWNCYFGKCDAADIRQALIAAGINEAHLGGNAVRKLRAKLQEEERDPVRKLAAIGELLSDPGLRNGADLRISIAGVIYGEVPRDYRSFRSFAMELAGVGSTQSKDAACRWCRPAGSEGSSRSQVGQTAGQATSRTVGNRPNPGRKPTTPRSETDQRTSDDEPDRSAA
jgi:hypothetical protein